MQYLKLMIIAFMPLVMMSCQSNSENQKSQSKMSLENVADTTVAACKLTDKEQAERSQRLRKELFSKVQEVKELEDGYALKLPGDREMADKVYEHVMIERACCPFFEFEITMTPDHGPVWLKFKGNQQVKEMLKSDMEELKKAV